MFENLGSQKPPFLQFETHFRQITTLFYGSFLSHEVKQTRSCIQDESQLGYLLNNENKQKRVSLTYSFCGGNSQANWYVIAHEIQQGLNY